MKEFKGKAIYNPSGRAGEYSYWACNFYVGCSNGCTYCYLKKGRGKATLGGDKPTLKKCFRNDEHALKVFEKELKANLSELQKHGLFFSFTTDPMLPETYWLTVQAHTICKLNKVPVKILTKRTDWIEKFTMPSKNDANKSIAFGFTLTGHDELEQGASTNSERIEAMKRLHDAGFKTFASIEPIIDFDSSLEMIQKTAAFCDLYKIGLESGKSYLKEDMKQFVHHVNWLLDGLKCKVYWKKSISDVVECNSRNSVPRDYNMFN